ncbi:polysaccharide biosynthesis tyrosine autokinase [Coraliomargarita sp. SDUM461004]|uniref:Polysaccharide biosynthesis tyrosine autokinase n=1 Tax=Thalassobacterium sedimentorum TaxID=3041258 RepID=A0ABU1AMC7_9BACT|nr:polysaccharide biosynthesis tyrosine autokinase [Coraliomargarita sp. SDUM461004]MDQ8195943.1 polysaccharide biosynthesis tyrosine autokinase [Coraliomargarita sp. SDUM461004]
MSDPKKSSQSKPDETLQLISIMDLIMILRQRWLPGFALGLFLAAACAIFFMSKTPMYETTATMVVEVNAENIVNVAEVVESGVKNSGLLESAMNTHLERLKSRAVAQLVADSLSADEQRRLTFGSTGFMDHEDELSPLPNPASLVGRGALSVSWLPDSQVIRIQVRHPDAEVAKFLADRYVSVYIRLQLDVRNQTTGDAVQFLDEQAVDLRNKLEQEEGALQQYREANDLVTVEQDQKIVTERLSDLSSAITAARVRQLQIGSRLEQITAAGEDLELLMNIPFIGGRAHVAEIYASLEKLQQQEQVLAKTYLERHPKRVENQVAQTAVETSLWRAIEQGRQDFEIEQQTVLGELASLEAKMKEAEQEARRLEQLSIEYRVLSRKVEAQRKLFDMVTSRYNETSITQQMNLTSLRPLDKASVPSSPYFPNVKKITVISILLFAVVFIGLPLILEFLDNRLRTFADIEGFVGKSILGDVRFIQGKSDVEMAELALSQDSDLGESFAAIYGSLRLNLGHFNQPLTLVVTSSVPSEGKSVVASNLAAEMATHGSKTLIVDCDLRRPSQHRYHNLENKLGVVEWVRSEEAIAADLMQDTKLGIQPLGEGGKLFLLSSGGSTTRASSILENKRMDLLISRLKQEFDVIIFDTPPVGIFHDATMIADYADHCIFVARQNETTRQKTRHSVAQMDRSKAPVLGVIFNGVKNHRLAAGYGTYGEDDYTSYSARYQYGYGKDAASYQAEYSDKA